MTAPHHRPWLPISLGLAGSALAIGADFVRYEMVTVATYVCAETSFPYRVAVHVVTFALFLIMANLRTPRAAAVWAVAAVIVTINVLATSRLVLSQAEHPHTAVAGIALQRQVLGEDVGYYEGLLCFNTFERSERIATIDGRNLAPPFLPLPVDWSSVDNFAIEMTCTRAAREQSPPID